jgi:hypothetical protein
MGAAFVIVGKGSDVNQPLVARSYARDTSRDARGRPSLSEAFRNLGITERTSRVTESKTGATYVLPNDAVLLMIGNTAELEEGCKVANDTKPFINFIEADSGKSLQLRYARIQVHSISGQTDTLIALGAALPAASEKGWHELDSWPTPQYVTTKDVSQEESLPGYIREIKKNDGKKWING